MSKSLVRPSDTIFTYKDLFVKDKTVWCTSKSAPVFYYLGALYEISTEGSLSNQLPTKRVGMNFTENTTLSS